MDSAYFLRLANTLCEQMSKRTKHRVNYAFQATRTMAPRIVRLHAKAITRSVTNISVKINSLG